MLNVSVNGRVNSEDVFDPFQEIPTEHLYKLGRHPIEKDTAILPTNSMEQFVNVLLGWLAGRLTGAIVWGNQRVGKTQAIRYVMANGQSLLGSPIPISLLSAWDPAHSSLSENRFFRELLEAIGSPAQGSATAGNMRRSAIDVMTDQVRSAKEYRYLLFIDEAQWLAPGAASLPHGFAQSSQDRGHSTDHHTDRSARTDGKQAQSTEHTPESPVGKVHDRDSSVHRPVRRDRIPAALSRARLGVRISRRFRHPVHTVLRATKPTNRGGGWKSKPHWSGGPWIMS